MTLPAMVKSEEMGRHESRALPAGWVWATAADLADAARYAMAIGPFGSNLKVSDYREEGVPLVFVRNIRAERFEGGNAKFVSSEKAAELSAHAVESGDLLMTKMGEPPGDVAIYPAGLPRAIITADCIKFRPAGDLNAQYLLHALRSHHVQGQIKQLAQGVAQQKISLAGFRSIRIPLAPRDEQNRLAAKVDKVLSRLTAARDRLAKVPPILNRFRQSVLAAACSGRLTADWRDSNPITRTLTGGEIIKRISTFRGVAAPITTGGLPDVPSTWAWTTFGHVIGELRNGISTKPQMQPPGNAILRINAVRGGRVLFDDLRFLPDSEELISVYQLRQGDLLFTRYNGSIELLGVCGMVRNLPQPVVLYPDKLMRVRFDHPMVLPEYVEVFFQAPAVRDRLMDRAKSSAGQQGVSGRDVKEQPFAVPPLEEQREIVKRLDGLFALSDKIEAKVAADTTRAEKLVQATLAKAFRGELVPTEAELAKREGREYETAEALLARIKVGAPSQLHSRPALPGVQTFRTDLFEDRDVREHDEVQGIASDLGVLRGHWTTPPLATLTFDGTLAEAFKKTCNKNSPDRVVADPELNHAFVEQCRKLGLENPEFDLCFSLLNMRKGNDLKGLDPARKPVMAQWRYAAASEIAARVIHWRHGLTVDRIICHPTFVEEFEQVARSITPGYSSFEYRWAALGCRKVGQKAAKGVVDRLRWSDPVSFAALGDLPDAKGVYALRDRQHEADCIFVYGTESISRSIAAQTNLGSQNLFGDGLWRPDPQNLAWTYAKTSTAVAERHGIVNELVSRLAPILNVPRAA
jgi:type I restriction enzyme S subunit